MCYIKPGLPHPITIHTAVFYKASVSEQWVLLFYKKEIQVDIDRFDPESLSDAPPLHCIMGYTCGR